MPREVERGAEHVLGQMTVAQCVNHILPVQKIPFDMAHWADETDDNIEPRAYLESFYMLVAMQLGDPEQGQWLRDHIIDFREMYKHFLKGDRKLPRDDPNAIVLSYIFWYQRNRPG